MMPMWAILLTIGASLTVQAILNLLLIGLVHDMVVKAYRQLWREQAAAVWLREKDMENTPPAQEADSVH